MIGETIGQNYKITELLGSGSMGDVFKGWDTKLGRNVAIKVLKKDVSLGSERFFSEATILANLNHGNICSVYNFLTHLDKEIMVLQYIDGVGLDKELEEKKYLQFNEVKEIAKDVLGGLIEAHHAQVIHRDLKPANLMRTKNATGFKTIITDFGIARAKGQARMTKEGMVSCTIEYASPEQIQGEEVGPASDLYSFGVVLYELLTGRLVFEGKTAASLAHSHVFETPDWARLKDIHGNEVVRFLKPALEKKISKRYQSAQEMLAALNKVNNIEHNKIGYISLFLDKIISLKGYWPYVLLTFSLFFSIFFVLSILKEKNNDPINNPIKEPLVETNSINQQASSYSQSQESDAGVLHQTNKKIANEPSDQKINNQTQTEKKEVDTKSSSNKKVVNSKSKEKPNVNYSDKIFK